MRIFLFCYPIKIFLAQYLEELVEHGLSADRFREVIDFRYRQRGYRIYWLLFGRSPQLNVPDITRWSDVFDLDSGDGLISAGISFKQMADGSYPDPAYVLGQLPKQVDELVLGGFHQYDCVERLARFAHEAGIKTWIDEDTTQFFFHQLMRPEGVPLTRGVIGWSYFHIDPKDCWSVEEFRKARRSKPWLTQL